MKAALPGGTAPAARRREMSAEARYRAETALYDEMYGDCAQCRYCLRRCHMTAGKFYITDHRSIFCGAYAYPDRKPESVCDGRENCGFFERDLR